MLAAASELEGVEISIDNEQIEIYWENIRVPCQPNDFGKAMKALVMLKKMGAYFG